MSLDRLIDNIRAKNNPAVAGLDPKLSYLPNYMKEKAYQALLRRGFSPTLARAAIADYQEDKESTSRSLERDFTTLYARYARQYQYYELRKHLFDGLLRKGYKMEAIQERWEEEQCKQSKI